MICLLVFEIVFAQAHFLVSKSRFAFFYKGDKGVYCEAPPLIPLKIPQTPARFLCVTHIALTLF
ncbi:hypothetical protein BBW65_00600 [Helicobacter enhydrae]|uniref:Uncharacterized protein n=1 Tax=Helicobacter enhydrae TaxID=222136 RepID=A0A1B1U3S8_9HELI|nr:hypothetical protein BBW65_00600 [Helicobacter enhydrae]